MMNWFDSLWRKYKWHILSGLAALAGLAYFFLRINGLKQFAQSVYETSKANQKELLDESMKRRKERLKESKSDEKDIDKEIQEIDKKRQQIQDRDDVSLQELSEEAQRMGY